MTAETKKRNGGLGLRCKRPRPPKRRDRLKAKEVLARGAIEAKSTKVLVRSSRKPRPFKIRGRPQEWWRRARRVRDTGKRVFIGLCCLYVLVIICFLP